MKVDELIAQMESQVQRLARLESESKKLQQSVADISAKMANFTSGLAELKGLQMKLASSKNHKHEQYLSIEIWNKNITNLVSRLDRLEGKER